MHIVLMLPPLQILPGFTGKSGVPKRFVVYHAYEQQKVGSTTVVNNFKTFQNSQIFSLLSILEQILAIVVHPDFFPADDT